MNRINMKKVIRTAFYILVVQLQWTLLVGKLQSEIEDIDGNVLDNGNSSNERVARVVNEIENDFLDELDEDLEQEDEYWPADSDLEKGVDFGRLNRDDDEEEENVPDPPPTLPVQYDHFCKELPFFKGLELAKENVLFGVTMFYFNENNPNTLHIVLNPKEPTFLYDYLMAMFIDERGLPTGHFHIFPCDKSKPAFRNGAWKLGVHCTKIKWSEQWGNTEYMYIEKDPVTKKKLGKHSIFWSWVPDDGPRPNKLQLRFGFIQGNKVFVKFHSSVIDFLDTWPYSPPNDEGFPDPGDDDPNQCFQNVVNDKSQGNFIRSKDQKFLEINKEYMTELNSNFEKIFKMTTTSAPEEVEVTTASTTTTTTTTPTTTTTTPTTTPTTTTTTPTTTSTTPTTITTTPTTTTTTPTTTTTTPTTTTTTPTTTTTTPTTTTTTPTTTTTTPTTTTTTPTTTTTTPTTTTTTPTTTTTTPTTTTTTPTTTTTTPTTTTTTPTTTTTTPTTTTTSPTTTTTTPTPTTTTTTPTTTTTTPTTTTTTPTTTKTTPTTTTTTTTPTTTTTTPTTTTTTSKSTTTSTTLKTTSSTTTPTTTTKAPTTATKTRTTTKTLPKVTEKENEKTPEQEVQVKEPLEDIKVEDKEHDEVNEPGQDEKPEEEAEAQKPEEEADAQKPEEEAEAQENEDKAPGPEEEGEAQENEDKALGPEEESEAQEPKQDVEVEEPEEDSDAEEPETKPIKIKKPKKSKTSTTSKPHRKKKTKKPKKGKTKKPKKKTTKKPTKKTTTIVPKSREEKCKKISKKSDRIKCLCKGLKGKKRQECKCNFVMKAKKKTCLCKELTGAELVECQCGDLKGKEKKKCKKQYKKDKGNSLLDKLKKAALKAKKEALKLRGELLKMKEDLKEQLEELKDGLEMLKKRRREKADVPMDPPLVNVPIKHPVKGMTMYTGCGVQKGCVGDLPQCITRENCHFLVTYMAMIDGPKHHFFRFEMYLRIPEGFGYGAVGISTDKEMGDDSVVECSIDQSGVSGVYASWNNIKKVNRRVSGDCSNMKKLKKEKKKSNKYEVHDYVKDCNIVSRGGYLICTYYHQKNIKIPQDDGSFAIFNMEESPYFLLRAYGTTVEQMKEKQNELRSKRDLLAIENKTETVWNAKVRSKRAAAAEEEKPKKVGKIGKHKEVGSSPDSLNLNQAEEVPDEFIFLLIWHANFMLFGSLVLAPAGMFVVRYFKETWEMTMFCKLPLWLIVHFSYMIWALMFMIMGVIFSKAYGAAIHRDFVEEEIKHSTCGWFAFILFLIQFVAGNWLPYSPEKVRVIFRIIHWVLAIVSNYFCLIVAMLSALMASSQFPYFSSAIIASWMLFVLFMHIGMGFALHMGDREVLSKEKDGFMVYYRAFLPLPIPPVKRKIRGSTLRLVLFLWYQFGAFAAFIPIFISNSQGHGRYDCTEWAFLQFKCESFHNYTRM